MVDFWNSLWQNAGDLWNSPFRGDILRVAVTGGIFVLGVTAGRLWGMWRRYRQFKMAERGESDEVVTIEKILIDRCDDGTEVLRIRSCGRDPVETVFPNVAARDEFQARAAATKLTAPLVSMEGKMGSYLLQELAIWVCGQLRERTFPHDVWIMAPVYERGALSGRTLPLDRLTGPPRRPGPVPQLGELRVDPCRARHARRANLDAPGHGQGI